MEKYFLILLVAVLAGAHTLEQPSDPSDLDIEKSTDIDPIVDSSIKIPPYFVNMTTNKKNKTKPITLHRIIVKPAGNMVALKCMGGGNPEPNITWYKNGADPKRLLGDIKYNRWSLSMEDLVTDDNGNYTCVICNELGCINHTIQVDVIERFPSKQYVKEGYPQNLTVLVNSTAVFECPQIIADLEPYVTWVFYNKTVDINNISITPEDNQTKILKKGGDEQEIYEIQNVTYNHEGWYACVAANSLGKTASFGYLKVVERAREVGFQEESQPGTSTSFDEMSSPVPSKPKSKPPTDLLSNYETEETKQLSTTQLQRLVLLEQLQLIRSQKEKLTNEENNTYLNL